ncbi:MAG: hypothetical protein KatS3mg085_063 [Candidatus Dojkabacteria bacterium]|nr:MAG: hypothetical protein KatS3mg085_063 [Candidatus Dojkabacteria bacterium]
MIIWIIFLQKQIVGDFEHVKYSYSGDLFDEKDKWGLGNFVFLTKILYITGKLKNLKTSQKEKIATQIKQFEHKNGYIFDPLITGNTRRFLFTKQNHEAKKTRRAETRQSFAALNMLGSKPSKPFKDLPQNTKQIEKYLESFDWSRPWDAGSHLGTLLFFMKMNEMFFPKSQRLKEENVNFIKNWLLSIQSPSDGTWYRGNTPLSEKINGAMKILIGLDVIGIENIPKVDMIIDTALSAVHDKEACFNFNIVYVLYITSRFSKHRHDEIKDFMYQRLRLYKQFYHEDKGGFSFYRHKANDKYYGKKITQGLDEPDIHGTAMFVQGIALINQVLDLGLDYRLSIN